MIIYVFFGFFNFLERSAFNDGWVLVSNRKKGSRGSSERWKEKKKEKEKKKKKEPPNLKSMQQPKPMPHLMHRRLPQIVPLRRERRLGHAPRQHVAPVGRVVDGRVLDRRAAGPPGVRDGRRQGAVAEQGGGGAVGVGGRGEVGLEVEVQGFVVAPAQGLLHGGRGGVGGPGVVDVVGARDQLEGDAGGAVEGGEDGDLEGGFVSGCDWREEGVSE